MNIKRFFAILTAGALLTALILSNVSAKADKETILFIGDDITSGFNADVASIEMIPDYLKYNVINDTQSEMTSSQCYNRVRKNYTDDIKNSDVIVLSVGFFDFINPFLEIIYSYRDGNETFNEVKQKMKNDISNVIAEFNDIISKKDRVIDTTQKTIEEIKQINPNAEIYYLCSYNPFKAFTGDATYSLLNGQINKVLSEFYEGINSVSGITCISLDDAFNGYEGVYTKVLSYDVYPSTAGQFKIASTFLNIKTEKNEKEILTDLVTSKYDRSQILDLPAVITNNITLPAATTTTTTAPIVTTVTTTTTPKATTVTTTTTPKATTVTTTTTPKATTAATTTTPKATTVTTTTTPKATTAATTTTPKVTTAATTTTPKVTTVTSHTTRIVSVTNTPVKQKLPGDIDNDGCINAADLLMLMNIVLSDSSETEKAKYDLTNDKKTDISDVIYLRKLLA